MLLSKHSYFASHLMRWEALLFLRLGINLDLEREVQYGSNGENRHNDWIFSVYKSNTLGDLRYSDSSAVTFIFMSSR